MKEHYMKHTVLKRYPLGNKRFIWKQKDFALSSFGCDAGDMRKSISNLTEAGFNTLELGWSPHEKSWEAVELCEEYGVDLIFQDLSIMGGMQHRYLDREPKVDMNTVNDLIERTKDKKRTIGFYVWDEPWFDNQFEEARRQSDMLEAAKPDALLFSVALPSYNPDFQWENGLYKSYFDKFIKKMDPPVLSLDYYPIGNYPMETEQFKYSEDNQLDTDYMWCDLGLLRKRGLETGIPYWFYYQGCDLYHTGQLNFTMIRMMMYAAVMYGVKGLQHYRANEDAVVMRDTGEKGPYFEEQKAIHKEFAALGNTLMALTSKLVYHSPDLLPNKDFAKELMDSYTDSEFIAEQLPKRCSVGEFEDGYGNRYLVILNREFCAPLKTELKLKGNFRIYEVSRKDGAQRVIHESTASLPVELAAGDAMVIRVQPASEEPFTVEYTL